MSADITTKDRLNTLSKTLLQVHKSLLDFQKGVMEALGGKALTAYDTWQLSVAHPDFEWLRLLSSMIIRLDDATDNKDLSHESTHAQFSAELNAIFNDPAQHEDFKQRLEIALANSPELCLQVADLKRRIAQ